VPLQYRMSGYWVGARYYRALTAVLLFYLNWRVFEDGMLCTVGNEQATIRNAQLGNQYKLLTL